MDERSQTVNVQLEVPAEPQQIRAVIDAVAVELTQAAAWTLSGIAYYCT